MPRIMLVTRFRFLLMFVATLLYCSVVILAQSPTNCSFYSHIYGPYNWSNSSTNDHITGNHSWTNQMLGSCAYQGLAQQGVYTACAVHAEAHSNSSTSETGFTIEYLHTLNQADHQGISDGPAGGSAAADSEGATAANACMILPCGAPSITITGNGTGGGYTVNTNPANPYWQDSQYYPNNACKGQYLDPLPVCTPYGNPPYPANPPQYWYWDTSICGWVLVNGQSPVIVDTKGIGFQFTDPTKGDYVTFDLKGDGSYTKFSWPKHDSGNAWLVLDRDGDGVIKDGTQLFGNFTQHSDGGLPNHPDANGFLALAWYDAPAQGGDGNLIIDAKDTIWPKLKLWIDDHCYKQPNAPCQSLPGELHSLESEGITSISLLWTTVDEVPRGTPAPKTPTYGPLGGLTDRVGNEYKYYALLNPDAETIPKDEKGNNCCALHMKSHDGRWAVDVWLKYIQ